MSERAALGSLLIITSLLPGVAYLKWQNPLIGAVLALLVQFVGMIAYIKWVKKHKPGTLATVADLTALILIAIILGALVLGVVMYQHSKDASKLVIGAIMGGALALITMSISINAADKIANKDDDKGK